jgi:two-component system LytT family response regulator
MIKTLLVEDNPSCLHALRLHLQAYCPDVNICASASTMAEAVTMIDIHQPELVISDITLPDGTVFDKLLSQFAPQETMQPFELIIISARTDYHQEALQASARAYIIKPYTPNALKRAIAKVREYIYLRRYAATLRLLFATPNSSPNSLTTLLSPKNKKKEDCILQNILAVEADYEWSYVLHISTHGGIERSHDSRQLQDWEQLFSKHLPDHMMRVQNGVILNLAYVESRKLSNNKKDEVAVMYTGHEFPISRLKKKTFRERWARVRQIVLCLSALTFPIE